MTHRQKFIGGRVNTFALKNPIDRDAEHPIWYCGNGAAPYVAVNEAERPRVADSAVIRSRLVPHLKHRTLGRIVIQMLPPTLAFPRTRGRQERGPVRAFNADFLFTCN